MGAPRPTELGSVALLVGRPLQGGDELLEIDGLVEHRRRAETAGLGLRLVVAKRGDDDDGNVAAEGAHPFEQAQAELTMAAEMYGAMEMTFWLEKAEAALAQVAG